MLNLTDFSHCFMKVTLLIPLFGPAYCNMYHNLQKIVLQIKFYLVNQLAITTFLVFCQDARCSVVNLKKYYCGVISLQSNKSGFILLP